jgi:predicted ATPase
LKLTNWRNFRRTDISFQRRAFIIGPNASGKSNLLDAIRFLAEIATAGSGGLQAAVKKRDSRGGLTEIRCVHARDPSYVELDICVGRDDDPEVWRYLLQIKIVKPNKFPLITIESIWFRGKLQDRRELTNGSDPLEFSQTHLEQAGANKDFRELAEFLASCRYLHVVPQIVRDRARGKADGDDPFGGDLLRRMKDTPKKFRDPRLRRISKALKLAVPQFVDLQLKDDSEGVPHLYASYEHWRANVSLQSESAFSDGTIRLIGLLWSIAEKGGPLLLEEPELSLNDAVVNELPRMFSTMQKYSARQVITTTHSLSLLNGEDIGLREVHRIIVDGNGSHVVTLADEPVIVAEVENETTIGQAVSPLLRPKGIEKLGLLDVAN